MQSLESNCAVRLTCHMDGSHHLVHFHLLQDITQPELWVRPLLPAKNRSSEVAKSIRYLSQLRYGIEVADVIEQLALKDQRREYYEQGQPTPREAMQTKAVNTKQPTKPGNLSHQPQQPPVMKHGKRKTTKT